MMRYWIGNNQHHQAVLKWTTEPPMQEGWYWARMIGDLIEPEIRMVYVNIDHEFLAQTEYLDVTRNDYISHWLGPLPVPEPPTEGE